MVENIKNKKISNAIVIGATGLVGKSLVQELVQSEQYVHVICVVRKNPTHAKSANVVYSQLSDFNQLEEHVNELAQLYDFENMDVFSCLGTTLKTAGSKAAFYTVDYACNYMFAKSCAEAGAGRYFLVSSIGAKDSATSFYLKTKGELEKAVSKLTYNSVYIFQPSLLIGLHEGRVFENIGQAVFKVFKNVIPQHFAYRPIEAQRVAKAMQLTALKNNNHDSQNQNQGMQLVTNTAMLKMTKSIT